MKSTLVCAAAVAIWLTACGQPEPPVSESLPPTTVAPEATPQRGAPAAPTPPAPPDSAPPPPATSAPPAPIASAPAASSPIAAPTPIQSAAGALGQQTYRQACAFCHDKGVAGAPRAGDASAWAPRLALGMDALYAAALRGKGAMPAKGGNPALSDDAVKAAVDYLAAQAH